MGKQKSTVLKMMKENPCANETCLGKERISADYSHWNNDYVCSDILWDLYKAGMNGHIIKPVSLEAIAKVLDEIFAEKEAAYGACSEKSEL